MDYRLAYQSLSELFPQVDNRILKAVAIEHRNDIHAAVEFILHDVLPSLPAHDSHEVANEVRLREHEGAEALQFDMPSSPVNANTIDLGESIGELSKDRNSVGETEDHSRNIIFPIESSGELSTDGNTIVVESGDRSENVIDVMESVGELSVDRNSIVVENEDHCDNLCTNLAEVVACDNEVVSLEEDNIPLIRSARSSNVFNVDILEDCVTNAKSNKKALVSAVESVIDLTREVEILEERVKQAKEEAFPAGKDIFAQVEGLKQMLEHAKEANDMHAGEVYGEKSILLTEARELQARLLNLQVEKNRSFSVINEIRETLETRIAAAKDDIAAAEREKLERGESAKKALKEQEILMEAIAHESQRLQQEAEENAKLRDFLVDRGRLVDTLQGEMAVIFEDIMLLKKRVDERAPVEGSLLMRTYSSSSSSSLYSHKSMTSADTRSLHSADRTLLVEQLKMNNTEGTEDHLASVQEKVVTVSRKETARTEDDWELLRDDVCPF